MGRRHHKKYESSSSSSSSESECEYSSKSCSDSDSCVSDSELESELEHLEDKFDKKLEKLYCKFLWRLRREPCLLVNGSDAHGNFYNTQVETIAVGAGIPFNFSQYLVNIAWNAGDSFFTVQRNGLYYFSYNIIFDQPCQIAIFVNGVLDPSTVTGNNSGANPTSNTQLLRLMAGDTVELRNWKSNSPLTLSFPASGDLTLQTTNFDFTIFKIAPLISECGEFPVPFPKPTCEECHEHHHQHPKPPCPPTPPKDCKKDKKCRRKFEKLDKNNDGVLSYDEYKKACKERKHHKKH